MGSDFTAESLWRTKTVKSSFASQYFLFLKGCRCWRWRWGDGEGLAAGVHCSDLTLTLARCPARWNVCVCVCASSARLFRECSALIGTGRHFVGLYCHMPLPILLLIRAAITGTNTYIETRAVLQGRPTHFGTRSKARPFACD